MTIKLQKNISEKTKMDKSISTVATYTGDLKAETSVTDPVILVECDITTVGTCNYMEIPDFNRKYFITAVRSVRKGLVEFTAHVDVLSTYASQIRQNEAIIRKQEKVWNLYLNDGSLHVYQNRDVITKTFPSGFSGHSYVLAVAGS